MSTTPTITEAARLLLIERDRLLMAQVEADEAKKRYELAEEAYFKAHGNDGPPANVVLYGKAILPCDDWYDLKPGKRLEFHTVEVLS